MATVFELVICHVCHKRLMDRNVFTTWEDHIYCEHCFEEYLESIEPSSWKDSE